MDNNIEENNFNTELYIELYADLFAYRFYLLDIYENNETEIIKKIKMKVFNLGYNINNINLIVYNFYRHYNIDISLESIENVVILVLLPVLANLNNNNEEINNNNEEINNNNEESNNININNINNINELLLNIFSNPELESNPIVNLLSVFRNRYNNMEDVKVTLDETEIEKLTSYTLTKTLEEKCTICISELEEGNKVIELPCKHIYHCDCIKPLLLNYDYKCPVCRHDIGKHKINI